MAVLICQGLDRLGPLLISLASLSDPRPGFHPTPGRVYERLLECDGHHRCQLRTHLLLSHRGVSNHTLSDRVAKELNILLMSPIWSIFNSPRPPLQKKSILS